MEQISDGRTRGERATWPVLQALFGCNFDRSAGHAALAGRVSYHFAHLSEPKHL